MQIFSQKIAEWYHENKRDLPWRNVSDPYLIWISEIVLQQTRVNQGLAYYLRFVERFPDVVTLAQASEDEVLKFWQGLGYYSRARNVHKASRQIVSDHKAVFPTDHKQVLKLSGIGVYTAAAICSFAYNQPFSVVDGNVYRVLSRYFGIDTAIDSVEGGKQFAVLAQELLDVKNPALHNQSVMEFGALQCVPSSPNCSVCPLIESCKAYELGLIQSLPVKKQKIKTSQRFFNYLFITNNDMVFLQKREQADIWRNLYEFPLIESEKLLTIDELMLNDYFKNLMAGVSQVEMMKVSESIKHILTHQKIHAQFFHIRIRNKNNKLETFIEVPKSELDNFAVSRLMELFLEKNI